LSGYVRVTFWTWIAAVPSGTAGTWRRSERDFIRSATSHHRAVGGRWARVDGVGPGAGPHVVAPLGFHRDVVLEHAAALLEPEVGTAAELDPAAGVVVDVEVLDLDHPLAALDDRGRPPGEV